MGNSCSAAAAVWATDDSLRIDSSSSKYSHHRVTRFGKRHAKKTTQPVNASKAPETSVEDRDSDGSGTAQAAIPVDISVKPSRSRNGKRWSLRSGSENRNVEQQLLAAGPGAKMPDSADGSLDAKYHLGKWLGSGKHGCVRVCWPKDQYYKDQPVREQSLRKQLLKDQEQMLSFSSPLSSSSLSPLSSPASSFGFQPASSPGFSSNGVSSPSPASSPFMSQELVAEDVAGGAAKVAQRFAVKSIAKDHLPRLVSAGSSGSAASSSCVSRGCASSSRSREAGGVPANLERAATAVREVDVLERLQGHAGVVRLHDVVDDAQHTHIVMQLCQGPSLKDHVATKGAMSEREAARLMRSVVGVLAYCHERGIVHRDVKDANFLFLTSEPDSPLVAIDFGLATFCSPGKRLHEVAGSPCFVAPEVLRVRGGVGYGPEVDVWSVGVLLYLMLAGRVPFDGVTIMDVFRAVASAPLDLDLPPLQALSPEAKDLLSLMLSRDVTKRPSALDVLNHPWMQCNSEAPSQ